MSPHRFHFCHAVHKPSPTSIRQWLELQRSFLCLIGHMWPIGFCFIRDISMVQVPLLLFCFGMVQHSFANADALNASCTVHRIEKSMYGTGSEPYYCTPNANRFSKIKHKKFKLAMQCYYECMKEYTITQLNETFGWLQPAVTECTVDLSDRKCHAFPLKCTSSFNSFPNACSGSIGILGVGWHVS